MEQRILNKYEHLYSHTQLSLQSYHLSMVNFVDAIVKRKDSDQQVISNVYSHLSRIRDTIEEIQNIQQRKLHLKPHDELLKNMVSLRTNFQNGMPKIIVKEETPLPPWTIEL